MDTIETRSLRDRAYDEIKNRIITMEYRPGEYLNEARISEETNIGRTPVHQALDRLMIDGMVEVIPRKGVIVKPVTMDEVRHVVEARLVNETYCARVAAEMATDDDLDALSGIISLAETKVGSRDTVSMMHLDREFHMSLARSCKNPILSAFVNGLQERMLRFWFLGSRTNDHPQQVQSEHVDVYDAVAARKPDLAAQAMKTHIEAFRERIIHAI